MPAAPVTFPLGPPSISGNLITVDQALANPTVITREIAQLAQQRFFASRVFSDAGGVEGGAVLYELPPSTATDLFAERGVQEVEPGAEFPILTFLRGVPVLAKPKKMGGKFPVTREARKRNNVRTIQQLSLGQIAARAGTTIDAILATAGITNWYSSPRVTPGTAILYEAGAVGGWANEFPLAEETWYEPEVQSDWYQWSVSPAMFVDDPYALEQLTGIA
jgi:hypothetical protein